MKKISLRGEVARSSVFIILSKLSRIIGWWLVWCFRKWIFSPVCTSVYELFPSKVNAYKSCPNTTQVPFMREADKACKIGWLPSLGHSELTRSTWHVFWLEWSWALRTGVYGVRSAFKRICYVVLLVHLALGLANGLPESSARWSGLHAILVTTILLYTDNEYSAPALLLSPSG